MNVDEGLRNVEKILEILKNHRESRLMWSALKIKEFISEEDKNERVLTADGYAEDWAAYQSWHSPLLHLTKYRNVMAMPYYTIILTIHMLILTSC